MFVELLLLLLLLLLSVGWHLDEIISNLLFELFALLFVFLFSLMDDIEFDADAFKSM